MREIQNKTTLRFQLTSFIMAKIRGRKPSQTKPKQQTSKNKCMEIKKGDCIVTVGVGNNSYRH